MHGLPGFETTVNSVKFPLKRDETRFEPPLHRRRNNGIWQSAGLPCDYSHQGVFLPLCRLFIYPNPRRPSSFVNLSGPLCKYREPYSIQLRRVVFATRDVDREASFTESHRGSRANVARTSPVAVARLYVLTRSFPLF